MPDEKTVMSARMIIKAAFSIIGIGITLVVAVYGFINYIDGRIEDSVTDSAYIQKIAAQVRPFVIFDAKGSILIDMGAMEKIETLEVISKDNGPIPDKIILSPKKYLNHPPLITSIDQVGAVAHPTRGQALKWEYTFEVAVVIEGDMWPESDDKATSRYRLEIME